MPTYLYLCEKHGEFEVEHSIKTKLEVCPKCQEEGADPPLSVTRLINCVSTGVVELTGDELVQKLKLDTQTLKRDAAKSEKIYSNLLGEDRYQSLQTRIDKRKR